MSGQYDKPTAQCDLIMKGGITSGIVYPKALLALAEKYRFRSIGGASAGAIGAAVAAAAEYGRAKGGFDTIEAIPQTMADNLLTLFQPGKGARPLFDFFVTAVARKKPAAATAGALAATWPATAAGLAIGALLAWLSARSGDGWGILSGVVLALLLGAISGMAAFVLRGKAALAALTYGLCPGPSQPGSSRPGFSDWIADTIEAAAGRMVDGKRADAPLTFGDLWEAQIDGKKGTAKEPAIDLRMMTTNLSMRRPSVLPKLGDRNYYFRPDELKAVLPAWIVDFMTRRSKPFGSTGYRQFPEASDLPVAAAVRMSLSFPFLISAVPLYRRDFGGGADRPMTRVLFSDGGISSNFPIHFFDALLPRRPTFAISLDDKSDVKVEATDETASPETVAREEAVPGNDGRVRLNMDPKKGQWIPIKQIDGIFAFAGSIVYAAKDWQDQIQSTLSGYRERIARVYLTEDEGGLNLAMGPATIHDLVNYGRRAGDLLVGRSNAEGDVEPFDFEEHRWRRFLVAFAVLEDTLGRASDVWFAGGFKAFITGYMTHPRSYQPKDPEWLRQAVARFDGLMEATRDWKASPLRSARDARIPRPATDLKITARAYEEDRRA